MVILAASSRADGDRVGKNDFFKSVELKERFAGYFGEKAYFSYSQNDNMSDQFHIEEFSEYKVFLYDKPTHGDHIDESIVIPYSQGDVYFIFYGSGEHENETKGKAPNLKSYIYIRTERFSHFVDILRHEKPLYIAVDAEEHSAYITTELEPVGEGDEDQS